MKTTQDGYKSVEYGNLTALLVEAIKDLYDRFIDQEEKEVENERKIASLEAETKNLRSEIDELKKSIEELKSLQAQKDD